MLHHSQKHLSRLNGACRLLCLGCVTLGAFSRSRCHADDQNSKQFDVVRHREILIPQPLQITRDGRRFGGDIRIGDLNGDGRCDFLVYRCNHGAPQGAHAGGIKPSFLGAFEMDGTVLWTAGEGGNQPSRPMSVAVSEVTGDKAADVICFWHQPSPSASADWQSLADVVVEIRDGRTGKVVREAAPPEITMRRLKDLRGANWVHQRILIANLRGTDQPRDLVMKLGNTYVALDESLQVLWTYQTEHIRYSRCPSYIPAVGDLDGDGRDEVNGGYFVLDNDGKPLWQRVLGRNMDSVTIAQWDAGRTRAICSGFGHVLSASGDVVLSLGEDEVPHGQEVRVADFRGDLPGPEMALRAKGHTPDLLVVSSASNSIVGHLSINGSPTNVGMEAVYWNGPTQPALLYNGGMLRDLQSGQSLALVVLPPPGGNEIHRMGFNHAIPANLFGGDGEELVLWDPTATKIFIYGSKADSPSSRLRTDFVAVPRQSLIFKHASGNEPAVGASPRASPSPLYRSPSFATARPVGRQRLIRQSVGPTMTRRVKMDQRRMPA